MILLGIAQMNDDVVVLINIYCTECDTKAIALQDDKPVCLKHFSKIYQLTGDKYEERYKI